jgi:MFS transporter, OFA family, oxalate/formate antiporter
MTRWRAVVGGIILNLSFGSLYAWSVFVLPFEKEFGWTRAQTSWVYTIAIACTIVATLLGGRLQDRRGPRITVLIGGSLLVCGYFLSSLTSSLSMLYVSFGVVGAFGGGFGYAAPMPVVSKWFPDKRGVVVGILVAGYAAASAIMGPIATALIEAYGWRATFRIVAAVFLVMILIGSWLLENPPADYRPQGWAPSDAARKRVQIPTSVMVSMPTFWALWVGFCFGSMAGQLAISQLVPFARSAGLGALAASLAMPIAAIGNVSGRIVSGWLSDRIGRLITLRMMIFASAIFMPALYFWREQPVLFFVFVAAVYWCYGTQMSVFASTSADFYGTEHLGLNWAVLLSGWAVAGMVGPVAAGWVFDRFQSYRYAFIAAAAFALLAVAVLGFARDAQPGAVVADGHLSPWPSGEWAPRSGRV